MPEYPPLPPRPENPYGQPDTPVMGSPQLARLVWSIMNQEPSLRSKVSRVQTGPTPALVDFIGDSKIPPEKFARTNVLGLYDLDAHDIWINPDMPVGGHKPGLESLRGNPREDMIATLVHELEHARGGDEMDARFKAYSTSQPTYDSYRRMTER